MLFADDSAICTTTEEELQTIGLVIAIKKQKSWSTEHHTMEVNLNQKSWFKEEPLNVFKKFKYLGGHLSNDATMRYEVPWRI